MERDRFVALDSLRGVCALIVALFHFPIAGFLQSATIVSNGYLFVDFFFVLSGFVIATVYEGRLQDSGSIWRFLLRRFGRLWPLHAAVLALLVAIAVAQGDLGADEKHSVRAIWTNLAMLHGLGTEDRLTWNGPSWSIGVEWTLYVLFAFLAPLRHRAWIFVACVVAGALVLALKAPFGAASTYDFGAYRGLAGFFTGALVARIPRRQMGGLVEASAVAGVIAFVHFAVGLSMAPLVFGVAVYVFAWSDGPFSRALNWGPLARLGEWSYSIYMIHSIVVAILWSLAKPLALRATLAGHLEASPLTEALLLAMYVAALIAGSALTYAFIEKPGRAWFNRRAAPTPAPSLAVS